jgi:hypothetical protein
LERKGFCLQHQTKGQSMTQLFVNNFSTTVGATFGIADTTLAVASSVGLPALTGGDTLRLTVFRKTGVEEREHEVIMVTSWVGNALTVVRAVEGAAASQFLIGDRVEARLTASGLQGKQEALVSGTNIKTVGGVSLLGSGDVVLNNITLTGNLSPYVTQATTLTITNFDIASTYSVTATGGTASIVGDAITYTAGATAGSFAVSITLNGSVRAVPITVQPASIVTPTITAPTNGQTGLGATPTITTSAFATIGVADTHLNTDWEVRTAAGGAGTLVWSSLADAVNKTSIAVGAGLLVVATTYYARARHRGNALGVSGYAENSFTTAATFGGAIGTQGGQGFGVAECPSGARLTALGLSAMTGTADKTSINYGNYQHTNGSIMCFVPKFFYRIGHASSPRAAIYGLNSHDIVGIETFASEAAANAGGYALHRAFINAGAEINGFFADKYLATNVGTTSCKSVASAHPISLATTADYNPSSLITGCTGILADAVVLSRSRGAGYNCAASYHQAALAMLALAHGQAATATTFCAWYDAGLTTNFPKGCNNGSFADTNDGTVTYTAAFSGKPLTRAAANFAKTTHNGQECGVADINGSMWQALIGLTMAGASATDTVANTSGTAYLLKRSADFAALTGGHGSATDAWGTAANLATRFDEVVGFEPWLATTGWLYTGNGTNQVFAENLSGIDYNRTNNGIAKLTGMSATGTGQFGADGCYQYGVANQVPIAAGLWSHAASAGAFCRVWDLYRSVALYVVGFRACACGS